jgi:hypothetical protein
LVPAVPLEAWQVVFLRKMGLLTKTVASQVRNIVVGFARIFKPIQVKTIYAYFIHSSVFYPLQDNTGTRSYEFARRPVLAYLHLYGTYQSQQRFFIREQSGHTGPAVNLLMQPLQNIGRTHPPSMFCRCPPNL